MATRNESKAKKFSNWLQCICCLNVTQAALNDHVMETLKKEIMSWDENIRENIPSFFRCVSNDRVKVKHFKKGKKGIGNFDDKKTLEKGKWICDCAHLYCNIILEKLLALQQNPGFNIVWNSNICKQLAENFKGVEVESNNTEDYVMGDELENIPRVETALLKWKKDILSLDKDIAHHIPRFLSCVSEERIKIQSCKETTEKGKNIDGRKTNENEKWFSDCEHLYCNAILQKLLTLQQYPAFDSFSKTTTGHCVELESGDADDNADESESVSKVESSLLALVLQMLFEAMGLRVIEEGDPTKAEAEEIDFEDIFDGCKQEHIWCIANMFMQRGKAKTNISNTGPENTDASMFFKMTKNCKLFEIENENYLYDDIIRCRDLLHHSASNRVNREESETHFKTMIDLLTAFCKVPKCVAAILKIEKMLKETILSVSVPEENLKELAGKALKLKKSALKVDEEIDRASGISNDDNTSLLKDTEEQIEISNNSQSDSSLYEGNESREDIKQEILHYKNRVDEIQQEKTQFEKENQTLKNEIEKEIDSKEEYKREKLEYKQRLDDIEEKKRKLENENENLKDEMEKEKESNKEQERKAIETEQKLDDMKQKAKELENENKILKDQHIKGPGIQESSPCTAEEYVRKKDPGKHFENMTKLVKMHADKKDFIEALAEQLNPLLDQIVEDASGKDEEIKESLQVVYEEEKHESERQTEENVSFASDNTEAEEVEVHSPDVAVHDDSELMKSHNTHVWSVESEQSYTIKVEGDSEDCDINGCCMLPTGEILLADFGNSRMKKINDMYQVISVCDLPKRPICVCYCGNNEAVLALYTKRLQFVDVRGGMSLTRKVRTDHECRGLTCHGNQLYVIDSKSVYIYSTVGVKQRVLYTHPSGFPFYRHIAVSDNGNTLYITDCNTGLHTIDSVGNHLYTFTDTQLSEAWAVCVDDEGHVLISQYRSKNVLQLSSDGKKKLGILVDTLSKELTIRTICFKRGNATLIVAGYSNNVTVLKLK